MKKLSVLQWIALITAFVGLLMESNLFGDSEIINNVIGKVLIVLGLAKTTYDLYISFQAEDVAEFANDQNSINGSESKKLNANYSSRDVKKWANNL